MESADSFLETWQKKNKVRNVLQRGRGKFGGLSSSPLVWERWGTDGSECPWPSLQPDFVLGLAGTGRLGDDTELQSQKIPTNSISALGKNPLPSWTRGF